MKYRSDQVSEFQKEFKRRSRIRSWGALVLVGLGLAFVHLRPLVSLGFQGILLLALMAFGGYLVYNWRCPACGTALSPDVAFGKLGTRHYVCPKCGVPLL